MINKVTDPKTADKFAQDFAAAYAEIEKKFDVQPLIKGKTKQANWLQRRIAFIRVKRKLSKLLN